MPAPPFRTRPASKPSSPAERPVGPQPDARSLHDAAVRHLARYSATQAELLRVLARRIDRWARAAAAEPEATAASLAAAREVVAQMVAAGAVDDVAFAAGRARSLARAGRSRRAIGAHLAARGVPSALTAALPDDPVAELAAALAYARRRRMGPFRAAIDTSGDDALDVAGDHRGSDELGDRHPGSDQHRRELGRMARAGFAQPVAEQALRMDPEEANALVVAARLS